MCGKYVTGSVPQCVIDGMQCLKDKQKEDVTNASPVQACYQKLVHCMNDGEPGCKSISQ